MTAESTFQVIERADGTYRWRLRVADDVLATSDERYGTAQAAMRDIQRIKRVAAQAGVESVDADDT